MTRYLIQFSPSVPGYGAVIKNPQDRAEATRPMFEALGGTLEVYYFAVGENTVYLIGELPDEVSLEALLMVVMAGGAVTDQRAVPILTAAEAVAAMEKAAEASYRPPSA